MKRFIFPIFTILLSMTMFMSCSSDDEPIVEQGTGEILIDTYVDNVKQETTKATVYLDGGYATGAGKYKGGSQATVAAYANSGYTLASFEGNNGKHKGQSSYSVQVPGGATIYYTAKFNKQTAQKVSLSLSFGDKGVINKYEHMWCDLTINGNKSTIQLDLRTGFGWSSSFYGSYDAGTSYTLSNFRSHYVASGTASEARDIFNSTNNFGVVYRNGSVVSTISGTLNSNTSYDFYID